MNNDHIFQFVQGSPGLYLLSQVLKMGYVNAFTLKTCTSLSEGILMTNKSLRVTPFCSTLQSLFSVFLQEHNKLNLSIFVVVQSLIHVRLSNPMDCSMPGFPVIHHLPEFAQTHVHQVGDAIQQSHPLSLPSPPALSLSQHQGLVPMSW